MYAHERSLVKKFTGKPFILLGVNSDSKSRANDAIKKNELTWPSWWDGGDTSGPIARAWGVRAWPTLLLIDHKGVIRQRWEGSPGNEVLDAEIGKLIADAEKDAATKAVK